MVRNEQAHMPSACPACGNKSPLFLSTRDMNREASKGSFDYYRCFSCRLIFLSPVPGNLGEYYPKQYYAVPSSLEKLAKEAEKERYKIDIIQHFAQKGRLLEIGPSYGLFTYLAKQAGFDVDVIEMDERCCRFIKDTIGARATNTSDISGALNKAGPYDVIALWQVIEHLPDPWPVLDSIAKSISPGGILAISAPNPDAFQFRVLGRLWTHVDAPRHTELIPMELISKRMEAHGFKTVLATTTDQGSLGWNSFGWAVSLGNLSSSNFLKRVLQMIGHALSKALSPIESRNGSGSAYTIVLQKEGK